MAQHAIRMGSCDPSLPPLTKLSLTLESARVHASQNHMDIAVRNIKHVVMTCDTMGNDTDIIQIHVEALCLLGEWLSQAHSVSMLLDS